MRTNTKLRSTFVSGVYLLVALALVVGLALSVGPVQVGQAVGPTEKWVDQAGGSDANDGDTEATAYATLQHAIDNSDSGTATTQSIIHVKDGTYETTGQTNRDGYSTAILIKDLDYLTIQAVSGHNPKVKPGTAEDIVSVSIENCDHLIVDNIDSDQTTAEFDNWHVWDSNDLTVRNSTFEGGEDGIDFNTGLDTALIENNTFKNITTGSADEALDFTDGASTDVVIQDNLFDYNYRQITLGGGDDTNFIIRRNTMDGTNSEEAIRLIGASDVLVENNVIMNNMQQGVYVDTGCSNITVHHNTFFNNDQEGGNGELRTKVTSADIVVKNNIFYGNGSSPVFETTVSSLPGEDYNLAYNYGGSFTFGANTITGQDPLFVSTTAGSEDLHLQGSSPAIEAGTNLGVIDDKEGSTRPRPPGTAPDMGAYESTPLVSLGNYVWDDANGNGIQDAGEVGVQGIDATLYDDANCTDNVVGTDTTDANGLYLFTDVPSDQDYCIQFSSIPGGWIISPLDQGLDDTVNSDADPATAQIQNINLIDEDLDEDMGLQYMAPAPVGGVTAPVSKVELLAPWMGLVALAGLILAGAVVVVRKRVG